LFGEQGEEYTHSVLSVAFNTSNGRYFNKETVLSSITSGGEVDITVDGHTDITGAVIASIDENGNDTGNLSLTTGSLDFADLTDTHYSTDSSVSLNTNLLLGENTTPPPKGVTTQPQDSKGDDQPSGTTNLGLHDSSSYGKDKTLATVGEGSITVGGEESEPEGLNRDTDSTDKELYSVDRTKADLDVTVDNQILAKVADAVVAVTDAAGITGLSEEERLALAEVISAELPDDLSDINAKSAEKKEAEKQAFGGEIDEILAELKLSGEDSSPTEDGKPIPGELTVYSNEIRSIIMASQEDGVDPVRALIALEKLKADINSIPLSDISNPERQAEADFIITGLQDGILERMELSDALGMAGLPVATRKVVITAGKEIVEGGTEVIGPIYQKLKNMIAGKGPETSTANKYVNSVDGELDFYSRVDNAGFTANINSIGQPKELVLDNGVVISGLPRLC
jgi:hypothetical protein